MRETKITKFAEVEEITYECEECDFKTKDIWEATRHDLDLHCIKKQIEVGRETIYWFNSEEKAKYWSGQRVPQYGVISLFDSQPMNICVFWNGPGWYLLDDIKCLSPLGYVLSERESKIKSLTESVNAIKGVIGDV
jgi:hypothetical protein